MRSVLRQFLPRVCGCSGLGFVRQRLRTNSYGCMFLSLFGFLFIFRPRILLLCVLNRFDKTNKVFFEFIGATVDRHFPPRILNLFGISVFMCASARKKQGGKTALEFAKQCDNPNVARLIEVRLSE